MTQQKQPPAPPRQPPRPRRALVVATGVRAGAGWVQSVEGGHATAD